MGDRRRLLQPRTGRGGGGPLVKFRRLEPLPLLVERSKIPRRIAVYAPLIKGAVYGTSMVGKRVANHDRRCSSTAGVHSYTMPDFPAERRIAIKQRRARGYGDLLNAHRSPTWGRRVGDWRTHKNRRSPFIVYTGPLRRRKGDERRIATPTLDWRKVANWPRRRKDDERRKKCDPRLHDVRRTMGLPFSRKDDERRGPCSQHRNYYSSSDPRIQALERRKS